MAIFYMKHECGLFENRYRISCGVTPLKTQTLAILDNVWVGGWWFPVTLGKPCKLLWTLSWWNRGSPSSPGILNLFLCTMALIFCRSRVGQWSPYQQDQGWWPCLVHPHPNERIKTFCIIKKSHPGNKVRFCFLTHGQLLKYFVIFFSR